MTPVERVLSFSVKHARMVVTLTAVATLVLAGFAVRVQINPDFTSLLPQDDKVNQILKEYAGTTEALPDLLVLAATASAPGGDIFAPDQLSGFFQAVGSIAAMPGVQSAMTPFNLVSFDRVNGRLLLQPMAGGDSIPQDIPAFRARLLSTGYARNLVVSSDGTMLIAFFPCEHRDSFKPFMDRVDQVAAGMRARGLTPFLTGTIPLSVRTGMHLASDASRLLALAALIILLSYVVGFRSFRAIALPLLSVILGTVWTVGFMGVMGYPLSLITIVAPPLILIFGNEYNIFTTNEYLRVAGVEGTAPGWIVRASRAVAKPIAMAFLTTVVGFLSLCIGSIRQTRQFALTASFGSLACAFLALFFLPALFALLKDPVVRTHQPDGAFTRLMRSLARFANRYPAIILGLLSAVVILFATTLHLLVFNTDPASYFPQSDPVLQDMQAIYRSAGGYEQVSVSFDAPGRAAGYFQDPAILKKVQGVETALRGIHDISYALSLPDLLQELNRAATGRDELPANRAIITVFSRVITASGGSSPGAAVLSNLVNKDFSRLTLSFRIYNSTTAHYMDEARFRSLLASMNQVLAANPIGATPVVWGDLLRNLAFADSLRRTLLLSMALSIVCILALTIWVFRSVRHGLYPIVPLVTGLLLNYSMMALTRIPLDMTTIMVSNIAIGVGVDSAIYLVIQFRRDLARSPGDPGLALERTLGAIGLPILLSSASIIVGLLVFATASFRPVVYFGMLVLFTLLATTAGTLVTLPALLAMDTRARLRRAQREARP